MNRFFIYCCSGLGREVAVTLKKINAVEHQWDEIYFVDDAAEYKGQTVNGIPVWSFEEYLAGGVRPTDRFVIAAGEAVIRKKIHEKLLAHGVQLGTANHPENPVEETSEIGAGTIIQRMAKPGPNCKIGECVLLQGHSVMGHDVEVGNYCTISSFAFIGGDTVIGEGTYIAPGALLRNGLHIGKNCIIGMGSVVTKDIPDNSVAFGNPCKVARENTNGYVFRK